MAFLDLRFPDNVSYGAIGGPVWSTDVVEINSGHEKRNANWADGRCSYDVAHAARTQTQINELLAFFRVAKGRANSFRFKDWLDYKILVADGRLGTSAVGTGAPTYQIYKRYSIAPGSYDRKITRPVSGTLTVYRNASPVTVGAAAGNISIDYATGVVTFVADLTKNVNANSAKAITGITQANPGSVTSVAHGFVTGDKIKITAVGGMTQVNDLYFTITVVDANTFTIGINTTGYTAYTSGGTATKHGISQTNPARVYSTAHGFTNGQVIYLSGAAGMTQVNGLTFTVANAAADYFDLSGIDATAYGTYTGSGLISKFPQSADALTLAGEFDVPCRFDTDRLRGEIIAPNVYGWGAIPIIEVRE